MAQRRPMGIVDWQSAEFGRAAAEAVVRWKPDLIQIEHLAMAQYLSHLGVAAAPRVLTIHEPGARAARDRVTAAANPMARLATRLELALWKRFEREALGAVQTAIVFTAQDQAELADRTQATPIVQIPLGTVLPERPLDSVGSHPPRLCFVGSFIHPPNIDAAVRLASEIFPRVRQRIPDAQLDLVGADPPPEVTSLGRPGITVTGRVASVVPYLDAAAVVVAPVRRGGGMRVKVLEALAAGKALVASPLAIEGLAVQPGAQLLVATTDGEFADAIVRLIEDVPLRVALARRAREWAGANLGWDSAVAAYERVYDQLLGERAAA
jgi:glycosyltransferase involved in cell wall biosynthesis